ncbi:MULTISPECIES: phosphonate metabolism transcriptional regulator PhnF [unclassified Lentilitoribacter]|jgi:GntR family phosphonate transport system transcriptional regulator|uniref:phosphonate metabolism transcriptional regulator PhnF n=1 Tax=unclassified Lentilitoribacter TaxID=2647570 RepID=UPI0013A6DD36|nr:phosphonate metabolism transcriptional regulator PhnF [Lentilitoribacter sp. Alg239-R112]
MSRSGTNNRKSKPVWKTIAEIIQTEITDGIHKPGEKLPTEAAFVERFNVNRHTIRHALSSLNEDGIVFSKQGSGVFVSTAPAKYEIGKRVRFHQSIDGEGHKAKKETLHVETRPATKEEAQALKISTTDLVHIHEGIAFIDDQPAAHFISAYPAKKLPNLLNKLVETGSVTSAMSVCGINDYFRIETRLTAVLCNATTAIHLNLKSGAPLLRSLALNCDTNGQIIEYGRTWFSGNNIELIFKNEANSEFHKTVS